MFTGKDWKIERTLDHNMNLQTNLNIAPLNKLYPVCSHVETNFLLFIPKYKSKGLYEAPLHMSFHRTRFYIVLMIFGGKLIFILLRH